MSLWDVVCCVHRLLEFIGHCVYCVRTLVDFMGCPMYCAHPLVDLPIADCACCPLNVCMIKAIHYDCLVSLLWTGLGQVV